MSKIKRSKNSKIKLILSTILFLTFCNSAFPNDGIYLTSGNTIYPITETKISLEKEVLNFSIDEGYADVNIYFEFFNPETTSRKLKVGFQAPSTVGDVTDRYANNSQIQNFKIQVDYNLIPYELKAAECESCDLKDTSEINLSKFAAGVFVYLFEIDFKPGINRIQHSYSYPASNNMSIDQIYDYILKTGAKWAGERIKDFRLQIDFGNNSYFYVKDIFGSNANWSINGTGKITETGFSFEHYNRMVRVLSGQLEISAKNFKPESNLEFGVISNGSFINYLLDKDKVSSRIYNSLIYSTTDLKLLTTDDPLTKEELKICRNAIYAQHGYNFHNKKLSDFFKQFEWYLPDPNLTIEQIELSEQEKKYIGEIIEKEKNN